MPPPSLPPERATVDDFYAARRGLIPPLPWPTFSPPFSATEQQIAAAIWFLRALILGREEPKYWLFVSDIWTGVLSQDQLNNIAEAVLRRLGPEDLGDLARTLMRYAGWPRAFFLNLVEEARSGTAIEGHETLKAYMLACFEALQTRDRVAFLNYVAERWGLTGTIGGRRHRAKPLPQGAPRASSTSRRVA